MTDPSDHDGAIWVITMSGMRINTGKKIDRLLAESYPQFIQNSDDLKRLFDGYTTRKQEQNVLDFDDLLLFLRALLEDPHVGPTVRSRFDFVLVDEYQDTNVLQADIVAALRPDGRGLTVVGDDAQSIYAFRGATVRNILDFESRFAGTTLVKLVENYRSRPPLVAATNAIIAQAIERHDKELRAHRTGGTRPVLATCRDEEEQALFVVGKVLEHREQGLKLQQQAVLYRSTHHSMSLELELARRNIPFKKFGGSKFIEAQHVN